MEEIAKVEETPVAVKRSEVTEVVSEKTGFSGLGEGGATLQAEIDRLEAMIS